MLLPSVPSAGQNVLGHHFCGPVESGFWLALCSHRGKPPTYKRSTCIRDAWLDCCGVEGTVRFLAGLTIPVTASRPRREAACPLLGQALQATTRDVGVTRQTVTAVYTQVVDCNYR